MAIYRYTDCGLDNVFIDGMDPCIDHGGDEVYSIPNPRGLHKAIAAGIVEHPKGMSGKELRFLRTEMGMTQTDLAKLVHRDAQTVARWEKGTTEIDSAVEALVRKHAIERLNLQVEDATMDAISEKCIPTDDVQNITIIAGHDPRHYHLAA
jgi:DNA-binding transcriptional regulator YiaG